MRYVVHKFGGSSLADADSILNAAKLMMQSSDRRVVVASAMQGVTDQLVSLVHVASRRENFAPMLETLLHRHFEAAKNLLGDNSEWLEVRIAKERQELENLLRAQYFLGALSNDILEAVSGLGEVMSSLLLDAALKNLGGESQWVDAREILVVNKSELGAFVDWESSRRLLAAHPASSGNLIVTTGFIAQTQGGKVTTLGRNGSDYSGAIFAELFGASEVVIWSDVAGIYSADPRLVPEAELVERLSYQEAYELSYFGAKVIHPQTMIPVLGRSIPIRTRSSQKPELPGTCIDAHGAPERPIKGVTSVGGLAILDIEGAGLIGVPGTAERAFDALRKANINVVMISQGSAEHSICCVVRERDAEEALAKVRAAFTAELEGKLIADIAIRTSVAAVAVVGDGMASSSGMAARMFTALDRAKVNVQVIAQGSSDRSISVVVDSKDAQRAVRAVHSGFYLAANSTALGVLGCGQVGQAFLRQIAAAGPRLLRDGRVDFWVRGIANSRYMMLGDPRLELDGDKASLKSGAMADLDAFARHVRAEHLPRSVIVDCTGSDAVADRYHDWLAAGIDVVAANKHAGSGDLARYKSLRGLPGTFRYEATVGAGLPVVSTLRDLIDTGDVVVGIDGIFSGTLAYVFNTLSEETPFSACVLSAKAKGYTERDPREDLSGLDVARKLVILARECGHDLTLESVEVENLVPEEFRGISPEAFLEALPKIDESFRERERKARSEGKVLRYVAHLGKDGLARVGLQSLADSHSFAHIRLTDNVIQFTTQRYRDNPLVVQGPGAGPEVTAAGVFADVLRASISGMR